MNCKEALLIAVIVFPVFEKRMQYSHIICNNATGTERKTFKERWLNSYRFAYSFKDFSWFLCKYFLLNAQLCVSVCQSHSLSLGRYCFKECNNCTIVKCNSNPVHLSSCFPIDPYCQNRKQQYSSVLGNVHVGKQVNAYSLWA